MYICCVWFDPLTKPTVAYLFASLQVTVALLDLQDRRVTRDSMDNLELQVRLMNFIMNICGCCYSFYFF